MSDSYAKQRAIIERLYHLTMEGKIEWSETADPRQFGVDFSNYSVTLEQQPGEFEADDYLVRIVDGSGRVIDSFVDTAIYGGLPDSERRVSYQKIAELYHKARRLALGTDKALDEILQDLEDR